MLNLCLNLNVSHPKYVYKRYVYKKMSLVREVCENFVFNEELYFMGKSALKSRHIKFFWLFDY